MGQRELTSLLRNHRDAWAKRKGMGSQDSKQLYVESMLRVSQRDEQPIWRAGRLNRDFQRF